MKKKVLFLLSGFFCFCIIVFGIFIFAKEMKASPIKIGDELFAEKVGKKVYVINHEFPWPANSLVVEMEDKSILLVDTPYTPEATEDLLFWIDKKFGKRKITALNTGFHFDNLGGNKVLIEKNIPVYGSDLSVSLIQTSGEASRSLMMSWLSGKENERLLDAYKKIPYAAPNKVFKLSEEISIGFPKEELEIYYPGESHSPDNLVVYFPKKKLLFGGCMVKSLDSADLGNTADANLEEWPKSLKKVLEKYKDAEIVVPGHGKSGTTEMIKHTIELFK